MRNGTRRVWDAWQRRGLAERVVDGVTAAGAVLILVLAFWISYGVFVRYVMHRPDATVTSAAPLLLLSLAFAGMPYALRVDSFPKVTLLVDKARGRLGTLLRQVNLALMTFVGGFYAVVAGSAALRTHRTQATTEVLHWPEFIFWIPVAISIGVFTLLCGVKLFSPSGRHRGHS